MVADAVYTITPALRFLDLRPPVAGHERFIGSYLFCGARNVIVDVGPAAAMPNLLRLITGLGISRDAVDYVVLTHIHIDHAGGIGALIKELPRARVIAHPRARPHLIDPEMLWVASCKTLGSLAAQYGRIEPVPEGKVLDARDGMELDLGQGMVLELYFTPGHAPHHLSLYDRAGGVLIAGEAAGVCLNGNIRPATPPPFRLSQALDSIDKLTALKPQRICYGHFGCYDNAPERLTFIRKQILEWYRIISLEARAGRCPEDILATLREKDSSLDYLDGLERESYEVQYRLLINSINGLSRSANG
ncbi:MAG: MBL fold metallo-hydrolase [Dehalococcoidales bacterium]|nr:MBL fold metallo-hydrolase [Dehalococcoidales bacterium]